MVFFLGFVCGIVLGSCLSWLALAYMFPVNIEETGVSMFKTMQPHCCNHNCEQGRNCVLDKQNAKQ